MTLPCNATTSSYQSYMDRTVQSCTMVEVITRQELIHVMCIIYIYIYINTFQCTRDGVWVDKQTTYGHDIFSVVFKYYPI